MNPSYSTFAEFYRFYLTEHNDRTNRRLHFVGSLGVVILLVTAIALQNWWLLLAVPLVGYGFAWVGHFAFERNKPASFRYPLYSFIADWVMAKDMLTGKIRL